MSVTVEDLRNEIKEYNLEVLTDGDSTVIQRAIERAVIWAKAKVIAASGLFEMIMLRSTSLSWSSGHSTNSTAMVRTSVLPQDKKEDAMELLRAVYGDAVDSAGYQGGGEKTPVATGSIRPGVRRSDLCP